MGVLIKQFEHPYRDIHSNTRRITRTLKFQYNFLNLILSFKYYNITIKAIADFIIVLVMEENKLQFVVHGKKEGKKFVLEGITNYILAYLETFHDKTIIVTFETPVTPNEIKMNKCILIN